MALERTGYRVDFMGGYRPGHCSQRHMHSCGLAIDINQTSRDRVTRLFPHEATRLAARYGLLHGAVWNHADTGHFEVRGGPSWASHKNSQQVASLTPAPIPLPRPKPEPEPAPTPPEVAVAEVEPSVALDPIITMVIPPLGKVIRPYRMVGELEINGRKFEFVSGGRGASIPLGAHKITPGAVGPWGRRHGALGIAGGEIWDPQLKRYRDGIEFHKAYSRATGGCIGLKNWAEAKRAILAMVREFGNVFLNVGPRAVNISPEPQPIEALKVELVGRYEFKHSGRLVAWSHKRSKWHRFAHRKHHKKVRTQEV